MDLSRDSGLKAKVDRGVSAPTPVGLHHVRRETAHSAVAFGLRVWYIASTRPGHCFLRSLCASPRTHTVEKDRVFKQPMRTDVLIVGAGVLGAGTAWRLARAGKRVVLADKGDLGRGASGANAGGIQLTPTAPELLPYEMEAERQWRTMGAEVGHDLGYTRCGGLRFAETPGELEELAAGVPTQRALGLDVRVLTQREAQAMVPALSNAAVGAIYSPQDGYAASRVVPVALARAAAGHGAVVLPFHPVRSIERCSQRFAAQVGEFVVEADIVVNAAGAWVGQIAAMLGVLIPVEPDVLQVHVTDPIPPLLPHVYGHARKNLTIKQFKEGNVVVGGGRPGVGGLDVGVQRTTLVTMLNNLADASRLFPALYNAHLLRSWAGVEGRSPDGLPYLGPADARGDFFILACCRGGFSNSPILTQLLSELILHGRTQLPIAPFNPTRFADRTKDPHLFDWLRRKRYDWLREVPRPRGDLPGQAVGPSRNSTQGGPRGPLYGEG